MARSFIADKRLARRRVLPVGVVLLAALACQPAAPSQVGDQGAPSATSTPTSAPASAPPLAPAAPTPQPAPTETQARPTPERNPFATMTSEQSDCLRRAWGDSAFAAITGFQRAPTPQENQALLDCGLLRRPGQEGGPQAPAGIPGSPGAPPAAAPAGPPSQPPGGPPAVPAQPAGPPPLGQAPGAGPLRDQVYVSSSRDGLTWSEGTLFADKASVPEVVRTRSGTIWAYWVDFSAFTGPLTEQIGVARSADGATWEKLGTVRFTGLGTLVPVDPDVIELPDGRLRMYFLDFRGKRAFHSAVSSDGLTYALEPGVRLEWEDFYDPDVVRLPDGRYRAYINKGPNGDIASATSPDGLAFTRDDGIRVERGSVPGSIVLPDGSVRLYGCQGGISAFKSADGLRFSLERQGVNRGCDPAVTATPQGYLMVYKVNAPGG